MTKSRLALLPFAVCAVGGCTSFATVRSAEVHPGPAFLVQASAATPPGNEAAWFWALDCDAECNHVIASADLGIAWGFAPSTRSLAYALTAGVSGFYPYLDGYAQFSRSATRPYGVGARIGIPLTGWNEYSVYGRLDRRLGGGGRLVLNPALFYHTGNSPNGENAGSFLAFVQSVGVLLERDYGSFCPAISILVGGGRRESAPFSTVFLMVSATLSFHGTERPKR